MNHYETNGKYVELYFDCKPEDNMIATLKLYRWRWYGKKGCWSNFISKENVEFAKLICKSTIVVKPSMVETGPFIKFDGNSLIVRSNSLFCDKHHNMVDMAGEVIVCDKKGNHCRCRFPIVYCENCEMYYVLEETYKKVKEEGALMCQVMDYKTYKNHGPYSKDSALWKEESLLKIRGYNVSKTDGISLKQRQAILADIESDGTMTKHRIMEYLDFFIKMHSDYSDAVAKWREDREFIGKYNMERYEKKFFDKVVIIK
jgi:hypothetical protein